MSLSEEPDYLHNITALPKGFLLESFSPFGKVEMVAYSMHNMPQAKAQNEKTLEKYKDEWLEGT